MKELFMYLAHAGHQHLTEQAARAHEVPASLLIIGTVVLVVGVVSVYVFLSKRKQ